MGVPLKYPLLAALRPRPCPPGGLRKWRTPTRPWRCAFMLRAVPIAGIGARSSVDRALASGARGRPFESARARWSGACRSTGTRRGHRRGLSTGRPRRIICGVAAGATGAAYGVESRSAGASGEKPLPLGRQLLSIGEGGASARLPRLRNTIIAIHAAAAAAAIPAAPRPTALKLASAARRAARRMRRRTYHSPACMAIARSASSICRCSRFLDTHQAYPGRPARVRRAVSRRRLDRFPQIGNCFGHLL